MFFRDSEGHPKGDGSVCYVKPESVEMAINVLHEGQLRPGVTIEVRHTAHRGADDRGLTRGSVLFGVKDLLSSCRNSPSFEKTHTIFFLREVLRGQCLCFPQPVRSRYETMVLLCKSSFPRRHFPLCLLHHPGVEGGVRTEGAELRRVQAAQGQRRPRQGERRRQCFQSVLAVASLLLRPPLLLLL